MIVTFANPNETELKNELRIGLKSRAKEFDFRV